MYSGKENKHLSIIIEDLNLPKHCNVGSNHIRRPNEILRQLLNSQVIQNSKYPFEEMKLYGFNIVATIATNSNYTNSIAELSDSRLMVMTFSGYNKIYVHYSTTFHKCMRLCKTLI